MKLPTVVGAPCFVVPAGFQRTILVPCKRQGTICRPRVGGSARDCGIDVESRHEGFAGTAEAVGIVVFVLVGVVLTLLTLSLVRWQMP